MSNPERNPQPVRATSRTAAQPEVISRGGVPLGGASAYVDGRSGTPVGAALPPVPAPQLSNVRLTERR